MWQSKELQLITVLIKDFIKDFSTLEIRNEWMNEIYHVVYLHNTLRFIQMNPSCLTWSFEDLETVVNVRNYLQLDIVLTDQKLFSRCF